MSDSHEQFDVLCALAASDRITSDEMGRLLEHLRTCRACRQVLGEYNVCTELLAERSGQYAESPIPEGMYGRFRARALNEGIQLPNDPEQPQPPQESHVSRLRPGHILLRPEVVAAAVFLVFVVVIQFINHVQHKQRPGGTPVVTQPSSSEPGLQDQLRDLREKQNELTAQIQKEEGWLRKARTDKDALETQLATLQRENDDARNRELKAEADVQRLTSELADAQTEQAAARNNSALNAAQITELKDRIAAVQLELSRERRLSASLEEMRNLMQNRDVRVIQLGTVNQGKRVRAFGRAFYIPGQKLVLFAYDLSDPEALNAHSFYVWGDRLGTDRPVQALGTLILEDQKDDRWAIRIESPDLFAQINEIFITMESSKGKVEKPTGQPMLLTSLTKSTP